MEEVDQQENDVAVARMERQRERTPLNFHLQSCIVHKRPTTSSTVIVSLPDFKYQDFVHKIVGQ